MKIRTKLTLQFALIVASILLFFSVAVYFFFANFREQDYYTRLKDRALTTSKLLIQTNEVSVELQRIIDRTTVNSLINEKVDIYNSSNKLIYCTDDSSAIPMSESVLSKIREGKEIKFKDGKEDAIGFEFNSNDEVYVVVASAFDKHGFNKLRFLQFVLVALFLTSMIIILMGGWFFSNQALHPIANVIHEVEKITVSNLNAKVNEGNGKDEIAQLAVTFNEMLARLRLSFEMQKNFVANASHELRTPLTALTGQISVALLQDRSTDDYKTLLQSLYDDIRYMNGLTNRLLELAMVNQDISRQRLIEVRIDEALLSTRTEVIKRNPDYSVIIRYSTLPDFEVKFLVLANEQLLKTAFINLIDNGCKFSSDHKVEIQFSIEEIYFKLVFRDNGIGIPEEELNKIFEPLYRSSNARQFKGHGLGLALTQKIIQIHGGSLKINSRVNEGTTIEVSLPRAIAVYDKKVLIPNYTIENLSASS